MACLLTKDQNLPLAVLDKNIEYARTLFNIYQAYFNIRVLLGDSLFQQIRDRLVTAVTAIVDLDFRYTKDCVRE